MSAWQPGPRPEWVHVLNSLASPEWIHLDAESLLKEATRTTGLSDFGGDRFREPLHVFLEALEEEAQLNPIGRILARRDVLNLLENRLRISEARRCNPGIAELEISAPLFITGLPRTGTSILHELLGQDPGHRVPLAWEIRFPCPLGPTAHPESDPRIERADREVRFWNHVVPEYATMHELGGLIPVECIMLTAHEFLSDQLSGCHQVPRYAAFLAEADMRPAYEFHRRMLQLLQWTHPGQRWVLKAPSHLSALDALLAVYPDARIIQTHRDPLKVMGSVASVLGATAWVRSDAVDPAQILQWFSGESCVRLLENAMAVRDRHVQAEQAFFDVRYRDLMEDPLGTIAGIYTHFGIGYSEEVRARMRAYLENKPKDKYGAHLYTFEDTGFDLQTERRRFAAYQERYAVPSEL